MLNYFTLKDLYQYTSRLFRLYWPLNQRVYDLMILPMAALKLDQVEYAAMKALAMFRCYYELSIPGKLLARQYEIAVVSGLHHYYSGRPDAAERVGQIILFMGNISVCTSKFTLLKLR